MWADPVTIRPHGVTNYILSLLQPSEETDRGHLKRSVGSGSKKHLDPASHHGKSWLESLPVELLLEIVSYLPTTAVLRLRRCSTTLLAQIAIDQRFWRDRLVFGELIGWLFDLDWNQCRAKDRSDSVMWDWKRLALLLGQNAFTNELMDLSEKAPSTSVDWGRFLACKQLAVSEGMENQPLGLRNRRRIWKILEGIERISSRDSDGIWHDLAGPGEQYVSSKPYRAIWSWNLSADGWGD